MLFQTLTARDLRGFLGGFYGPTIEGKQWNHCGTVGLTHIGSLFDGVSRLIFILVRGGGGGGGAKLNSVVSPTQTSHEKQGEREEGREGERE